MSKILEGKTALVTGGTRNLGKAIAERLGESGALVVINYAGNRQAAEETLAGIEANGGKAFLIQQALGPQGSEEALAAAVTAELTKRTGSPELDILVNNVGGGDYADMSTTTPEIFDDIVTRNMRVPFFMTKALSPHLREGGCIINLSSAASRLALREVIVYSMCKAAVDMFTLVMAKELGARRIRVNSVLPGFNETDSNAEVFNNPDARKWVEEVTALGRFGKPRDIAEVVHALATPAMGWVTGETIEASGGFRL